MRPTCDHKDRIRKKAITKNDSLDTRELPGGDKLLRISKLALDNAVDPCMWADKQGRIVYANDAACRALGFTKDELLSMRVWDFDTYYDEKRYSQAWDIVKREGLLKAETVYSRKDGSRFPVEISVFFLENEYMGNFIRDITERKLIIGKLEENERFLREVFECIQDGISVLDKDLNIIQVNPAIEKRYGHITGKKCFQAYHGRSAPCEMCPSLRAMKTRSTQRQVVNDLKGWTEIYAFPLVNDRGEVMGIIEHVRDINDRMRVEKALQESEEKFRLVADFTYDWESWIGPNGEYVYISPSAERITGYDTADFYRDPGLTLKIVHPDDRAAYERHQADHFASADNAARIDFRITTAHGETRWISHECQPVFGKDGKWLGRRASNRDITERKLAEEALIVAKQQAELYLDLMSHDINNMHQVALGYLELAKSMPPGEEQAKLLDKPEEVLHRSTQLISNVRKLEKLRNGLLLLQDVDVCQVLRDVQSEYGSVPNKRVTLHLNECERCMVRANDLLYDVFANLVSNAIKHTGESADILIDLDTVSINGVKYCRVMVDDNGPGIPDEMKDRIFQRLLKGTSKAKGMGLGLYLVKTLVDSYSGRVWVEDRVTGDYTKGTRFVVTLPVIV
ncbi:MAG TPA: PAS domain S-box protein [Methanocella sp.]|uniref:PAS domain S-box protein n=1 Tax=Methanocella sp. TaxID=2052833 RepID=UPI002C039C9E|nr:PAS domain S-box protein [Methanocella sp.]HTY89985.1 PAS domain S-box protein [Methanocella sp.]